MTLPHERAISYAGDTVSAAAILATFAGYLPAIAGLAGIIWYCIQIWESKTVQKRVRLWKAKRRAKRLAGLKCEVRAIQEAAANAETDQSS